MSITLAPETGHQEWVRQRVSAVLEKYSAYAALTEAGAELADEEASQSIFCLFHDNKNTPAARYYAPEGRSPGHVFCWVCRENLNAVAIYAKRKGLPFMDGLKELERRFNIRIEKRPEDVKIAPTERDSHYISDAWKDVPRVLDILERKLLRLRKKACLVDFVKVCRALDAIRFDFDASGKATDDMVIGLKHVGQRVDDLLAAPDDPLA